MQSTLCDHPMPFHVAMIMDGNGRWANQRGLKRVAGHREGAKTVRRIVEAAPEYGITTLTVYAFSSDNWKRPADEVQTLMDYFYEYFCSEQERCLRHGIRLSVIGRRDRLSFPLRKAIEMAEGLTQKGKNLHFRIAIDYSSRDAIVQAFARMKSDDLFSRERFSECLGRIHHPDLSAPDVDLLIRTGGEKRLSDYLLWECAYAEFYFTDVMWPDFTEAQLRLAVEEYHHRVRKFGAVPVVKAS
ncbi:MAG: polyprenyl diphosphate synthase [bacterium]|jgi:undecaprenyl diphosphate synthase